MRKMVVFRAMCISKPILRGWRMCFTDMLLSANVTELVNKWYDIIIPICQVIACGILMFLDARDDGTIKHVYRYLVYYVAISIATFYTWFMIVMQFGQFAIGDKLTIPVTMLILAPIGLFMIAYGYYQSSKPYGSVSIFGYAWVKDNSTSWERTHRVAGVLSSITGLIILAIAIINDIVFKADLAYLMAVIVWIVIYYLLTLLISFVTAR